MRVAARSDAHENRRRPFPGARPPRRGQWTEEAHRPPIAFATAVKVPNDRRRGSQFSSWTIILPHRRERWYVVLCITLVKKRFQAWRIGPICPEIFSDEGKKKPTRT